MSQINLNILRQCAIVVTFISSNRCNGLSMPYPSLFGTGCWWHLSEGFLIDLWGEFSHDPSSASFMWQSPVSLEWHILASAMKLHTDEESVFLNWRDLKHLDITLTFLSLSCTACYSTTVCVPGDIWCCCLHMRYVLFPVVMELYTGNFHLFGSCSIDLLRLTA
jgi:hypothetical protein